MFSTLSKVPMTKKITVLFSLAALATFTACGGGGDGSGGGGGGLSTQNLFYAPGPIYGQQATVLLNGDVYYTGGLDSSNQPVRNAFLYRSFYKDIVDVGGTISGNTKNDLVESRALHAQSLLTVGGYYAPSGSVLSAGGLTDQSFISDTAEVYDPVLDRFTQTRGNLNVPRSNYTMTEITDSSSFFYGQVLIIGGRGPGGIVASAEVYDPATSKFTLLSSHLNIPREEHTATALKNGLILIAGGNTNGGATNTGEIFDPANLTFSLVPNVMTDPRRYHTATYIDNKTSNNSADDAVLLAGGLDSLGFALDNADFYDPFLGRFAPVHSRTQEPIFRQAAAALPSSVSSDVALTGGFTNLNTFNTLNSNPTDQVEIFNYTYTGSGPDGYFVRTTNMLRRRALHTTDHIRLGTLLSLGGIDGFGTPRDTGEEFYY